MPDYPLSCEHWAAPQTHSLTRGLVGLVAGHLPITNIYPILLLLLLITLPCSLASSPQPPLCLHRCGVSTTLRSTQVPFTKFHRYAGLSSLWPQFGGREGGWRARLHLRPDPTADCAALPPDWPSEPWFIAKRYHPTQRLTSTPHIPYVSSPEMLLTLIDENVGIWKYKIPTMINQLCTE